MRHQCNIEQPENIEHLFPQALQVRSLGGTWLVLDLNLTHCSWSVSQLLLSAGSVAERLLRFPLAVPEVMFSYDTLLQLDLSLLPSDLFLGQFKYGGSHLPEQGREGQQVCRASPCLHLHCHMHTCAHGPHREA